MPARIDITNQIFGRLTAIQPTKERRGGSVVWECHCECGRTTYVNAKSLRSGNTRSCGCLQKEIASKNFSKDITNQRFGNLVAIKPTEERRHGSVVWECKCDCGNTHLTTAELLLGGNCKSCGCIHSRGNQKIKEILQQAQVNFVAEYQIRIDNINYYYDFAIIEDNKIAYLIEYDGELHFEYKENRGWNNKENWERTYQNDKIKNQYAKDKGIPLIRIPYFEYDKLTIEFIKEKVRCIELM